MRLKKYLNEESYDPVEHLAEQIKKDCKPFLSETRKCKKPMYRGHKKYYNPFEKHTVRKDRYPTDTHPMVHDFLDSAFNEVFKWKPRSEALFCLGFPETYYGQPHYIFPIGKFTYLWSPMIKDLWEDLASRNGRFYTALRIDLPGQVFNKPTKKKPEETAEYKPTVEFIKKNYKTTGLCQALKLENREIMVNCKQFYAVDTRSLIEFTDHHNAWDKFKEMIY